ncbi:hypothetical protein PoB_000579700 [Plakobranchus ocellatus]|uniref:Uncharacterized protein n=1 Tax=Plakobranchus ocellatus TaxID=259542 RepID=A0AAV3Y930_9GAST|nr:hypothetical protein PoB_000579700 [Plakobranchus ocellatus]
MKPPMKIRISKISLRQFMKISLFSIFFLLGSQRPEVLIPVLVKTVLIITSTWPSSSKWVARSVKTGESKGGEESNGKDYLSMPEKKITADFKATFANPSTTLPPPPPPPPPPSLPRPGLPGYLKSKQETMTLSKSSPPQRTP